MNIKEFIEKNNITFEEGSRNSAVVTLIGYAQFQGLSKSEFKGELSQEIKEDKFVGEETERLWDYCKARNYKNFWNTPQAKENYEM